MASGGGLQPELPRYTWDDVASHNTPESLWIVLDGHVYDVTAFSEEHPGGKEVLQDNSGKDATSSFEDVGHSADARELRKNYLIGVLEESWKPPPKPACRSLESLGWVLPALAVGVVLLGVYIGYRHLYKK